MIIKLIGISLIVIYLVGFLSSIFIYSVNRKKYYKLLEEFRNSDQYPPPYSFYCHTGFFGAAPMSYFFIGLKKKNKVYLLNPKRSAYSFFEKGTVN